MGIVLQPPGPGDAAAAAPWAQVLSQPQVAAWRQAACQEAGFGACDEADRWTMSLARASVSDPETAMCAGSLWQEPQDQLVYALLAPYRQFTPTGPPYAPPAAPAPGEDGQPLLKGYLLLLDAGNGDLVSYSTEVPAGHPGEGVWCGQMAQLPSPYIGPLTHTSAYPDMGIVLEPPRPGDEATAAPWPQVASLRRAASEAAGFCPCADILDSEIWLARATIVDPEAAGRITPVAQPAQDRLVYALLSPFEEHMPTGTAVSVPQPQTWRSLLLLDPNTGDMISSSSA
jgi:hypothetical protein